MYTASPVRYVGIGMNIEKVEKENADAYAVYRLDSNKEEHWLADFKHEGHALLFRQILETTLTVREILL